VIDSAIVLFKFQTTKPWTDIKHICADQLNREERLYPVYKARLDRRAVLKGVSPVRWK